MDLTRHAEARPGHGPAALTPSRAAGARPALALAVTTASGCAALGLQIVWVQQASLWLGHEGPAVLAVVAAFFGGLAAGALALAPRLARARRPARAYALCEAVVALWSLVLALMLGPVSGAMLQLIGAQPTPVWQATVAFVGCFVLLLPATAAMGATLPLMAAVLERLSGAPTPLARLYAFNTLGAVAGALGASLLGVPALGLAGSSAVCAVLNGLCAVAVWRLGGDHRPPMPPATSLPAPRTVGGRWLATLAATGLLGIGYEVGVVRVLSQVTEDTVYTFALLLSVYLVGTTAGAAAWGRLPVAWRARLLPLQAAACLLGAGTLWWADTLRAAVQAVWVGGGMAAALAGEALLALAAFGLPTLVMGALFAELAGRARDAGVGFARALGFNTLGAAAAPALIGLGLMPAVGPARGLMGVAAGYALLAWWAPPLGRVVSAVEPARARAWALLPAAAALGLALGVALFAPPLAFVDLPPGGRLLSYREGLMAAVSVVEDGGGVATLRINNRQQEGSSATLVADARQALIPLLLHPAPHRALFLGLGTGVTAASAAADPGLQVEVVELLPEVLASTGRFVAPEAMARLRVHVADARRYVRSTAARYDVVVADNVHPARSGTGALYTVEHFQAVRARLADGGLFVQWLPLHQMDLDTARSIVRSFQAAFPQAHALLATNSLHTPVLGLLGTPDRRRFDLAALQARMDRRTMPQDLAAFGLDGPLALLGSWVAGPNDLAAWTADAPLNTDDRPVVAYRAPRTTYAPRSTPAERLLQMLAALRADPAAVLAAPGAGAETLAAYWRARDRFLAAGRDVRPVADPTQMLAQVRGPLLEVLQLSPDFRPAYDPLLRLAMAQARVDPAAAQALLRALAQVQPARPEAAALARRLGPEAAARTP